jgi:hypothetical protein
MTKQLIEGLRTAAEWIESDKVEYEWGNELSCNWGILIQSIFNITKEDLKNLTWLYQINDGICIWSDVPNQIAKCKQTGLPLPFIFKKLKELKLKDTDYEYLEFLGGNKKDWEFGIPNTKENTVMFMRTWADSLERELLNQSIKSKQPKKVTVNCIEH